MEVFPDLIPMFYFTPNIVFILYENMR